MREKRAASVYANSIRAHLAGHRVRAELAAEEQDVGLGPAGVREGESGRR